MELTKPHSFGLSWPTQPWPGNPKALCPQTLIKMHLRSYCSLSALCSDRPTWPLEGTVYSIQNLWVIGISISVSLVVYCWTVPHRLAPYASLNKCSFNRVITHSFASVAGKILVSLNNWIKSILGTIVGGEVSRGLITQGLSSYHSEVWPCARESHWKMAWSSLSFSIIPAVMWTMK